MLNKQGFALTEVITYFVLFILLNYILFSLVAGFSKAHRELIRQLINKQQISLCVKIITEDIIFAGPKTILKQNQLILYYPEHPITWELKDSKLFRRQDGANNIILSDLDSFKINLIQKEHENIVEISLKKKDFELQWCVNLLRTNYE